MAQGPWLSQSGLQFVLEWGHPDGLKMGTSLESAHAVASWIPMAAKSSLKILRIVVGYSNYRGREPVAVQQQRLARILEELCDVAQEYDVILAIENHGDLTPLEVVEIIQMVGQPNLRLCFDTGNCVRLARTFSSRHARQLRLPQWCI